MQAMTTEQFATDPVCGMKVEVATAKHTAEHAPHTHYFCSPKCLAKFSAEPERYLDPATTKEPQMPVGTIYTCPMHPEIRQVGPGSCPICGMALEPAEPSLAHGPNEELAEAVGAFRLDYPESTLARARYGELPTDEIIDAIEQTISCKLSFPNPYPDEPGLPTRRGIAG